MNHINFYAWIKEAISELENEFDVEIDHKDIALLIQLYQQNMDPMSAAEEVYNSPIN